MFQRKVPSVPFGLHFCSHCNQMVKHQGRNGGGGSRVQPSVISFSSSLGACAVLLPAPDLAACVQGDDLALPCRLHAAAAGSAASCVYSLSTQPLKITLCKDDLLVLLSAAGRGEQVLKQLQETLQ